MPLNATEAERLAQSIIDLAEKMRLERRMITELRELFREVTEDLRISLQLTGSPPNAQEYFDDFLGILIRHSRRVSFAFSERVLAFLDAVLADIDETTIALEEVEEDSILALLLLARASGTTVAALLDKLRVDVRTGVKTFNTEQSRIDAATITRTNQREMDAATASATAELEADSSAVVTRATIAALAAKKFLSRAFNRANTIATTFTQKIAENTKNIEREGFFSLRNGFGAIAQGIHQAEEIVMWQTREDARVRVGLIFNHVAANQQVREGGFFIVSGEQLRFPGDPVGSMGNIAGCRCSAVTVIR